MSKGGKNRRRIKGEKLKLARRVPTILTRENSAVLHYGRKFMRDRSAHITRYGLRHGKYNMSFLELLDPGTEYHQYNNRDSQRKNNSISNGSVLDVAVETDFFADN